MKISILSMQKVDNFGSLLQAYSLQKIIKNLGHEVSFIDIEKKEEDYVLLNNNKIKVQNKFIKNIKKINKYFFNRIIVKLKMNEQVNVFSEFRTKFLNIKEVDNKKNYDLCVIGSDEVFNCLTKSSWGFTSQLFGNIPNAKKVITYAACCGTTTYDKLPRKLKNKISKSFKKIYSFSVRDQNTFDFVSSFEPTKSIIYNLDPVLVGNFDEEIEKYGKIDIPDNLCVVYSYFNRINKKEDIKKIKVFCKKNNLKIVCVGAPQLWCRNLMVLNPFQMLYVFSKAKFVITDTFHGTIFSVKYSDKFAVLVRESNKFKLNDLIDRLNIKKHLIKDLNDLDYTFCIDKDENNINEIIKKEAIKTNKYLEENI